MRNFKKAAAATFKKAQGGILCGALICGALGAYAAYSGYTNTAQNTFNIVAGEDGSESGKIEEDNWDPEDAEDLQPGATVTKDPKITSSAEYESWVFLTVEVPTLTATLDGTEGVYDAVTYDVNDGWTLVKATESETAGEDSVYIYGYDSKLEAYGTTTTLFDTFSIPDFSKVAEGLTDSIDITGAMVQTEGNDTLLDAAEALGLV